MEPLLTRIRSCTICANLPLGPRPILQAAPRARILIVGQAPGRITHAKGRPFDDPSGDRLRGWLGVDRKQFYDPALFALVPMGFCYPGTGRGGDLPPRQECAPTWRQPVLDALPAIALTLFGNMPSVGISPNSVARASQSGSANGGIHGRTSCRCPIRAPATSFGSVSTPGSRPNSCPHSRRKPPGFWPFRRARLDFAAGRTHSRLPSAANDKSWRRRP